MNGSFRESQNFTLETHKTHDIERASEHLASVASTTDNTIRSTPQSKWGNTWSDEISAYSQVRNCDQIGFEKSQMSGELLMATKRKGGVRILCWSAKRTKPTFVIFPPMTAFSMLRLQQIAAIAGSRLSLQARNLCLHKEKVSLQLGTIVQSRRTAAKSHLSMMIRKLRIVREVQMYFSRSFGSTGGKSGQQSKLCSAS